MKKTFRSKTWNKKTQKPKEPDYRDIVKELVPVGDLDIEVKVVLYGKAGTGKTTISATFPKPILLIDVGEKGTDSIRDVKNVTVLRAKSWDQLEKVYWHLRNEGGSKFKTVVIDTVSGMQELAVRKVLEDQGNEPEEGKVGGWGTMHRRDWGAVSADMKSMVFQFRELPMNVVFIAHDRLNKEEGEEGDEDAGIAPSVGPRLMPSVASTLNAAVGVIGNTFISEATRKVKIGKKVITKKDVDYCLRIGPHAYYTTKIRKPKDVKVPQVMKDPSYDKIKEFMSGEEE